MVVMVHFLYHLPWVATLAYGHLFWATFGAHTVAFTTMGHWDSHPKGRVGQIIHQSPRRSSMPSSVIIFSSLTRSAISLLSPATSTPGVILLRWFVVGIWIIRF